MVITIDHKGEQVIFDLAGRWPSPLKAGSDTSGSTKTRSAPPRCMTLGRESYTANSPD